MSERTTARRGQVHRETSPVPVPHPAVLPMLSLEDIATRLQVSRSTVERMRRNGELPEPDQLVGRLLRWEASTIESWLSTRRI